MFANQWFPRSYFPDSYFLKTGAASAVGSYGVGGRRMRAMIEAFRGEHRLAAARKMSYVSFVNALASMKVNSEIRRRQNLLTTAAYTTLLAEL